MMRAREIAHVMETLGNWGEFLGGIAVVVSLIYVSLQIRRNTAERRSDSIQSITDGNRELALVYVNNHEAGVAWHKMLDGEELSKREVDIMSDALYANLMLLEETYSKYRQGYIDQDFIDARVALVTHKVLLAPQIREVYGVMKQGRIYSQAFVRWFDEQLQASVFYEDRIHTIRESTDQSSNS